MKTIPEVLAIIKVKIEEHTNEMLECEKALKEVKADPKAVNAFMAATKQLVLKDKMVFHKACIAVLADLRQDIQK